MVEEIAVHGVGHFDDFFGLPDGLLVLAYLAKRFSHRTRTTTRDRELANLLIPGVDYGRAGAESHPGHAGEPGVLSITRICVDPADEWAGACRHGTDEASCGG